jgi:protein-S-isoprenylcysteine O-methyltransferase Ste14
MFEAVQKRTSLLDLFEQYALSIIFFIFAYRMVNNLIATGSPFVFIYLVDQLLVLTFILLRRRTDEITVRSWEWFTGFGGTFLPLLVIPIEGAALVPATIVVSLMLAGIAVHLWAKLTLRRSMGVVAANRGVKISGPYRYIRHPMYAGYVLVHIGLLLNWPSLPNAIIILSCWALFIWRIIAEERVLSADPLYREMKERTPFRLVPGIY